ncbi:hypothetical protein Pst134EA_025634 [Puccinia striiformis f. sp. tritici]|uniref:Uncharacterized protein n=2 Tax=Puccinia striiformis f. sp. tritici TaxID=168172 RepID=A0A0L0V3D9_9BASI|nr:hypothetical protein Pst134EA_025634 [Puccinia striiformis f. sp. tritici]KAI9613163.1 hypothetical protein H4Q26_010442 [Puccinia striiformis f. sp. tritici PST-130]KNE93802.1 hypothetical protein PSTG_12806 [Puccinia striiformis f. sp. tritici PST-78]KAH9443863.1 hypothetical protein Pst134EB_026254 [Puccinia striiformis f. sp. tritici]KAH9451690.1 hypothetical protein Pst134EA_025634 [Puccinia striiformis f. sp. tritici]KAI9618565.1 hypothetical protein H4Q26_012386 [Puccinia striiformis
MLRLNIYTAILSIIVFQVVAARDTPPLLAKRSVLGLNFCLARNNLEGCRGGDQGCCANFCHSHRVMIETEAAQQFCNPGKPIEKTPDPEPKPTPPPPPPAPIPTVVQVPPPPVYQVGPPPPVYYTQAPPPVAYSPYTPAPVLVQAH